MESGLALLQEHPVMLAQASIQLGSGTHDVAQASRWMLA
jgi:hypothetical protein